MQRLGRLLRPKPGENRAWFYTLVSRETVEQEYAHRRQLFLAEQGYRYTVLAPDELTQEALFVYRNWKSRRCFPNPARPQSPLWWVVEASSEEEALRQLPDYVSERSEVTRVRSVPIP